MELFLKYPVQVQDECLSKLVSKAKNTEFGMAHGFASIKNLREFRQQVSIQDYSELKPYVDRLLKGEKNLIWPGEVTWFAKSSGTSAGRSKFIPVTKASLEDCHFNGGMDMLSIYYHNHPDSQLFTGKTLTVGGSNSINRFNEGSFYGDLSAVLTSNLPRWAEYHRTPNLKVALMGQWEEKIDLMIEQTKNIDVTSITGVPSWTLVLCKKILEKTEKSNLREIWPNLEVFFHGGVSFQPYKELFRSLIGTNQMTYMETYNASEGFFGIQDQSDSEDLLLMLDYGIYYEFVPINEVDSSNAKVVSLAEVELEKNYALVISTNSGLWRYLIGDTVKFTSKDPFRIQITGRVNSFINAFGEELIVQNAELAMKRTCSKMNTAIVDYTAAPIFYSGSEKGGHQWLIEFSENPNNLDEFAAVLDLELKTLNSDYEAKRQSDILLQMPEVTVAAAGTFQNWLRSYGKLGGQHKVPRLSNDRKLIDEILRKSANPIL
ncbi:MAG: hypothetical protein ACI85F_001709 [Bacteroidia bacterium]|jgi:hypothetical protein